MFLLHSVWWGGVMCRIRAPQAPIVGAGVGRGAEGAPPPVFFTLSGPARTLEDFETRRQFYLEEKHRNSGSFKQEEVAKPRGTQQMHEITPKMSEITFKMYKFTS